MCGIIGIHSTIKNEEIFYQIFEGLMCLQHRGQDSVGISNEFVVRKHDGLVKYAFQNENTDSLVKYFINSLNTKENQCSKSSLLKNQIKKLRDE